MVCWLSPLHPKAVISESAKQLREERHLKQTDQEENESEVGSDEEILVSIFLYNFQLKLIFIMIILLRVSYSILII